MLDTPLWMKLYNNRQLEWQVIGIILRYDRLCHGLRLGLRLYARLLRSLHRLGIGHGAVALLGCSTILTATQQLHIVGYDLRGVVFLSILIPLAGAQTTLDI